MGTKTERLMEVVEFVILTEARLKTVVEDFEFVDAHNCSVERSVESSEDRKI